MNFWYKEAVFYHFYPLGFCDAPEFNDFMSEPVPRLNRFYDWIEHIKYLGADSVIFGPVFESATHGYDTADYHLVDRRLGENETFKQLVQTLHRNGIRAVIDAVFNHTGRDFSGFKDVLVKGRQSEYCDWFCNLDFNSRSQMNDPFDYGTWNGHYRLVKLNLENRDVKEYLFKTAEFWITEFDIDGLRLDCADCLDFGFMRELSLQCKKIKPDFWLMGEVVTGDYRVWVNDRTLDSVTNYSCYKGLYSSHNDKNYFEISHTLNREYNGTSGLYKNITLYNFVDNHDVNRIASTLKNPAHLYPLHILLFTIPGAPSIYYGSEWGIAGSKNNNDRDLRPYLDLAEVSANSPNKDLAITISKLSGIRGNSTALKNGKYIQMKVKHEQFAFARMSEDETIIVIVNSSDRPVNFDIELPVDGESVDDLLNTGIGFNVQNKNQLKIQLDPCWGRILKVLC